LIFSYKALRSRGHLKIKPSFISEFRYLGLTVPSGINIHARSLEVPFYLNHGLFPKNYVILKGYLRIPKGLFVLLQLIFTPDGIGKY
jgi:hypothetical protein